MSCEGESPADVENLGPVNYSPRRGFPSYYFPFTNTKGYQPPVVAVQFERPKRKNSTNFIPLLIAKLINLFHSLFYIAGVLINIECKAWAKNIIHDRAERRGSVHFELMID